MTPSARRVREFLDAYAQMGGPIDKVYVSRLGLSGREFSLRVADLEAMIAQHTEMVDVLKIIAETAADELAAHEASLKQTPGTLLPGHPDYLGE